MIHTALALIANGLNQHFKNTLQIADNKVVVSNLINSDGSIPLDIADKVVVCLHHIEQETSLSSFDNRSRTNNPIDAPIIPLHLNLYVLLAANFSNYAESLQFVSNSIAFFHKHPVFQTEYHPEMPTSIAKLIVEFNNTDSNTSSLIWRSLGAKYRPSVMYKLRIISAH